MSREQKVSPKTIRRMTFTANQVAAAECYVRDPNFRSTLSTVQRSLDTVYTLRHLHW